MFQGGNRPVKLGSYQIDEAGSLGFVLAGITADGWIYPAGNSVFVADFFERQGELLTVGEEVAQRHV